MTCTSTMTLAPHRLRVTVQGDTSRRRRRPGAFQRRLSLSARQPWGRRAFRSDASICVSPIRGSGAHRVRPEPALQGCKAWLAFLSTCVRYELSLAPSPRPDIVIVQSTRGNEQRAQRIGWFDFTVGGTPCRLQALRLLEPSRRNDLSVFFRDTTTGHEAIRSDAMSMWKNWPAGSISSTSTSRTTRRAPSRTTTTARFRRSRTRSASRFARARWTRTTTDPAPGRARSARLPDLGDYPPPTLRGVRVRGMKPRVEVAFQGWSVLGLALRRCRTAASDD